MIEYDVTNDIWFGFNEDKKDDADADIFFSIL